MKQKTRRIFWPWNYQKELDSANARSAEGWHLTQSGKFSRTEEQDAAAVYRYALDCREDGNFTELLYEKQGWELVCRQGAWLWFRKRVEPARMESEYVLHGAPRSAVADYLHRVIRPLDRLRNALLVIAAVLLLIPGGVTNDWTPRIACVPFFICIAVVKYAENIRKVLGEDKRK